jgi:enolase
MRNSHDFAIEHIFGWEALDSRGRPTVAAEVRLVGGATGSATVPSGTSKGRHEAIELRDGGSRYGGLGVSKAVENVNTVLADAVRGVDGRDQCAVDSALAEADGTIGFRRLGANAVLAISVATLLATAAGHRLPLWQLGKNKLVLPVPMVNVVSGGVHADLSADIQDFLVVPVGARSLAEAAEWCSRVRGGTAKAARAHGLTKRLVADEGRLKTSSLTNRDAIQLVVDGIELSGLRPGREVAIALDIAASQLFVDGEYRLAKDGLVMRREEFVEEVASWARDYPIVSVEDVLTEDDWSGWSIATRRLQGIQVAGDDLFATNQGRLRIGLTSGAANAVLVKPNQTGTVTSAARFVEAARQGLYSVIASDRSGETDDAWLADLAVMWGADQIKLGSTMRSERTAKWNRLLRIEAELGAEAEYAGWKI